MRKLVFYFFLPLFIVLFPISSVLSHDSHGKMIEATHPYPAINVIVKNQNLSTYLLEFKISNFKLISLNDSSEINKNEGHILLLINNKKKIMVTEETYKLSADLLRVGKNELFVMLMDSNHSLFTRSNDIIYTPKLIYKDK